jgi:acetyltransferase-like isoleucine patch superfamily enzyme
MNYLYLLFYYFIVYPIYKLQFKKIGKRTRLKYPLKIQGKSNITLGNNVLVQYKTWLASVPMANNTSELVIGNNSVIGNFNHIYATKNITIGKNVLTADKVYISDNSHSFDDPTIPIMHQQIKQLNEVFIGDGSWIGENVCIIGASVGKNCVIGANSVVTKDIPDYSIAVGSPAIVIKQYSFEKKEWVKK